MPTIDEQEINIATDGAFIDDFESKFGNSSLYCAGKDSVIGLGDTSLYSTGAEIDSSVAAGILAVDNFTVDMFVKVNSTWSCQLWRFSNLSLDLLSTGALKLHQRNGTVLITTAASVLTKDNSFHHVEVDEDGDNYYIFVDGALVGSTSSAFRPSQGSFDSYIGVADLTSGAESVYSFSG
jgi:hypothetical protein